MWLHSCFRRPRSGKAVIFCVANRGRIGARVGGLKFEDVKGEDGLV
jgi:hypothetical protein